MRLFSSNDVVKGEGVGSPYVLKTRSLFDVTINKRQKQKLENKRKFKQNKTKRIRT